MPILTKFFSDWVETTNYIVSLCVCVSFKESIRRQQDRRAELLLKRQEERMQAEIMDCTFRLLTNYQASGVILVGSPGAD